MVFLGHARKQARKYDLSSAAVETRKKATVHLSSRRTDTQKFLHLSEAAGVKQEESSTKLNQKRGEGGYLSRKCNLSDLRVVVQLFPGQTRQSYFRSVQK